MRLIGEMNADKYVINGQWTDAIDNEMRLRPEWPVFFKMIIMNLRFVL